MNLKKANLFSFVFIILIFSIYFILNYTNPFTNNFDKDWQLINLNSNTQENCNLPVRFPGKHNLNIQKRIPENLNGKYLYFFTSDQSVCIYVDNELIYEYGTRPDTESFANSTADSWHEVRIKKSYEGKMLRVFFTYPYQWHSGHIFKFYLSKPQDFLRNLVRKYWFGLVFAFFCLTSFGIIVSFSSILKERLGQITPIMFIALYALISSIWFISDNKLFIFAVPHPTALFAISIIALMLIDMPALLYASTIKNLSCTKFVKGFAIIKLLAVIAVLILGLFSVINIYAYRNLVHIYMYLSTLVFFITMGIGILKSKRKDLISPVLLYLAVILVSSIDMIIYIKNQEAYSANYSSLAASVTIAFLYIVATKSLNRLMDENKKAAIHKNLVTQDFMTGTKNKSAFLGDIDKLILSKDLAALTFDINELKLINDRYGHENGDKAVIFVAELLKDMFSKMGACYRSGPDEFTVIIKDCSDLDVYDLQKEFLITLKAKIANLTYPLSVAIGCAVFDPKIDHRFKDTVRRAKDKMKKNKTSQKLADEEFI